MERTARGDEQAFRLLVERWERPVFRFAERMLGSREDGRDLAQETFVRVYAQARRYHAQGRFRSWLFRIAGNLVRDRLRRRKILRWVPFEIGVHDRPQRGDAPDRHIERAETQTAVRDALARLPARQREAIVLRRYAGLGHAEIAAALGTTVPGVESLLQRAMNTLRRDLVREGVVS